MVGRLIRVSRVFTYVLFSVFVSLVNVQIVYMNINKMRSFIMILLSLLIMVFS